MAKVMLEILLKYNIVN